jgi:hypothetical protein
MSTNVPAHGGDHATTTRPTGRRVSRRRPVGLCALSAVLVPVFCASLPLGGLIA